ncbi:AraC family transcriptional regulator [Alsobacter soli]|uniref:AraC family transcriptional regulator n=1 Tax=Alsobacter soli TaxID=2109933 RepID=A0A2T1HN20_9HYPH|nr:GlxA family transcriptional regulator [Alsobacter soli]PSC03064.1 AraC family transcriptional regulator [Alsobacter soli]
MSTSGQSAPRRRGAVAAPRGPQERLRVGFVLANHFTLTAFSLFVDTLRLAADEGDRSRPIRCRWTVMSPGGRPVRASCGIEILPDEDLVDPTQFDYVAIVGGLLHHGPQVDARAEEYLRRAAGLGIPLIGVCTGSFILARAGLLDGRRCCVSWYHHADLVAEFDDIEPVSDRLFLIDGDRITCSGGAGAAEMAAALVERHLGSSVARKSLGVLMFESPRAESSTQPLPSFIPPAASARVRRAVAAMEQNLGEPLSVADLAGRAGVSERQLARLFVAELGHSPAAIYRRLRLAFGRWHLAQSSRTTAEIAAMAGFADSAHFSREFRKAFGETPSAFRLRADLEPRPPWPDEPLADRRPY